MVPSDEANAFIEQSQGTWVTVDLREVEKLRMENSEVAAQMWRQCGQECDSVTTEEQTLGGVSTLVVCSKAQPQTRQVATVVLYLYGGGFIVGRPEDDLSMITRLANFTGLPIYAPRYRLAPEHPYPAALDDCKAVYRALRAASASVFLVGESAGGNLALQLCCLSDMGRPLAVVFLSPWVDLSNNGDSYSHDRDPTLSRDHFLEPAARAYAGDVDRGSSDVSPLFASFPDDFPPTMITTGTRDLLLSDCARLAAKLRKSRCNVSVDLRIAEGMWHVYEWYPNLPEAIHSLREIAAFLIRHSSVYPR